MHFTYISKELKLLWDHVRTRFATSLTSCHRIQGCCNFHSTDIIYIRYGEEIGNEVILTLKNRWVEKLDQTTASHYAHLMRHILRHVRHYANGSQKPVFNDQVSHQRVRTPELSNLPKVAANTPRHVSVSSIVSVRLYIHTAILK